MTYDITILGGLQSFGRFLNGVEIAVDERRHEILQKLFLSMIYFSMCHTGVHQTLLFHQSNGWGCSSCPKTQLPRPHSSSQACKLDVKFMVQARQLRKWHDDVHYCAVLFCYLKEFAIKFRSYSHPIFMDDKHRCKVGEPGVPVAAVNRGKKVVVSTCGEQFTVVDHDFTKFGIIPSVTMLCDIPQTLDDVIEGKFLSDSRMLSLSPLVLFVTAQNLARFYGPDHNFWVFSWPL